MKQEFCCYHVTPKKRLPSILIDGLRPYSEPSWFSSPAPYVMLSLYPYWSLYEDSVLLEIKDPAIKQEYFDDPEGLRWNRTISPDNINAIVEFKTIRHGTQEQWDEFQRLQKECGKV